MRAPALSISIAALLAAGTATPSLACTLIWPPPPPPSQAVLDTTARAMLYDSGAIVEVVTTGKVTALQGSVTVLRVLRGNFRTGQSFQARASGSAACGPDEIPVGRRGFVQVFAKVRDARDQIHLGHFLHQPLVESLLRQQHIARPLP